MTLKEALDYGKERLSHEKIQEANLDAWLLLEFVTRINRGTYFGNPDMELQGSQWEDYQAVISLRSKRIPLQHITGMQEFMGFIFEVNEHVLIPRQDTEVLVEEVLNHIPKDLTRQENPNKKIEVLDMCTGSGCIIISLLGMRDTIHGTGIDISKEALEVARRNSELNQIPCTFIESDLFQELESSYDIIVSNPPYIPTKEIEILEPEVRIYDPTLALDGMEDGLYFYRKIIEEAPSYLNKNGRLLFEIGSDQGEAVSSYMEQNGFVDVLIKKDLAGLDRIVMGQIK